ncbi:MAG: ABC transporter ATP-binding protein [Actinomyces sp.]|nr:MAG: ABC transporter ATP-binding protein [Actinomyces sp.]
MSPLLRIDDLSVAFPTDDGLVEAVRNVSFDVESGEIVALVGESGSGKSVTALSVMRLHPANTRITGRILFEGRDLLGLDRKTMRSVRGRDIAMIFQDPMTALNPVFTVGDQIVEMIRLHTDTSKQDAWKRAADLLELVGVPEPGRRVRQYPHEFSGGMRQRAMIAMAIANQPKLLIADEPTTALDVTIQAQVLEVMKAAQEATGAAILMITHDLGIVAGLVDRVQVMYGGRIFERGTVDDIFYRSANPYTRGLMASVPRVDSRRGERLVPIPGAPPNALAMPSGCAFSPRCAHADERCRAEGAQLTPVAPGHDSRCHKLVEIGALTAAEIARGDAVGEVTA